jgi:hypothetical protein
MVVGSWVGPVTMGCRVTVTGISVVVITAIGMVGVIVGVVTDDS